MTTGRQAAPSSATSASGEMVLSLIVGVSKKRLPGLSAQFEVMREEETQPLFVTCAGIDVGAAKARLRAMHGRKRVPTLMKLAARLAKNTD